MSRLRPRPPFFGALLSLPSALVAAALLVLAALALATHLTLRNAYRDEVRAALANSERSAQKLAVRVREVIDQVDHRNLNVEVPFMKGRIPTTENIIVAMWNVIAPAIAPAKLERLVLWETENNAAEYRGE